MKLEWNGTICGIVTPYDPEEDGHSPEEQYSVGDTDDCTECDHEGCIAYIRPRLSFWTLEEAQEA
jgi:hypothetical protein